MNTTTNTTMSLVNDYAGSMAVLDALLERRAAVIVSGKTSTDKKRSALSAADTNALRIIGQGAGKVAKEARSMAALDDYEIAARSIGAGNFATFAAIYAATTGESIEFRTTKDHNGRVVSKAADQFRAFSAVLNHKMLNLEASGKHLNSKGLPSNAAASLMSLMSLHAVGVAKFDENLAARQAELATLKAAESAAEMEATAEAVIAAGGLVTA